MTGTSPLRSRPALHILVGAALILVVGVAVTAVVARPGPIQTKRVEQSFPGIQQVSVDIDEGSLNVQVAATGHTASVVGDLRWNTWREPRLTMTQAGGRLAVTASGCGPVILRTCESVTTLIVPAGVDLTMRADSGDITAAGLTGPVRLDVDSGTSRLSDLAGPLTVTVDSGDVTATGLSAPRTSVSVDSGDVTLEYTTAPTQVTLAGDSSDVVVRLPNRSGPYRVRTDVDSGAARVDVATADTSSRRIEVTVDSGDVSIGYLG